MHDHGTGQRLFEGRCITSVVEKAHLIRASRLQRGNAFEEQIAFACMRACPHAASAAIARGYGPLRLKKRTLPIAASTISRFLVNESKLSGISRMNAPKEGEG